MFQQITLIGHLGGDVETRFTPSGVEVSNFSVAVNKSWKGQDGQKQEKTTWFRCAAWGNLAGVVSQYLHKGSKVFVLGEVEARAYTAADGTPACSLDVRVDTIRFLDGKKEETTVVAEDTPMW